MSELKPLPYLDWVQSVDSAIISEADLFSAYNVYVTQWYKSNKAESQSFNSYRKQLFVDLLKIETSLQQKDLNPKEFQ